jgi:hypothetical protein
MKMAHNQALELIDCVHKNILQMLLMSYAAPEEVIRSLKLFDAKLGEAADMLKIREEQIAKIAAEMAMTTDTEKPIPDLLYLYHVAISDWAKRLQDLNE